MGGAAALCPVGAYCAGGAGGASVPCYPAAACTVPGLSAQPPCYWSVSTLAGSGTAGWADGQGTSALFNYPAGVSLDPLTLSVFVSDYGNARVRRVSPAGVVTTVAGSGAFSYTDGLGTAASFSNALYSVPVAPNGDLYAADTHNYRVRRISATGLVSTFAGSGANAAIDGFGAAASFAPTHIAFDGTGAVGFVVDCYNNKIRRMEVASALV